MIIIAVDLGRVRTGLAICDKTELLASPIGTITEHNEEKMFIKIVEIIKEKKAELIVMGLPRNMDNSEGESATYCREFAKKLESELNLEVILRDERLTTVSAHNILNSTNTRGKKRKAVVDTVSATIILQNYLDYRRINL